MQLINEWRNRRLAIARQDVIQRARDYLVGIARNSVDPWLYYVEGDRAIENLISNEFQLVRSEYPVIGTLSMRVYCSVRKRVMTDDGPSWEPLETFSHTIEWCS